MRHFLILIIIFVTITAKSQIVESEAIYISKDAPD